MDSGNDPVPPVAADGTDVRAAHGAPGTAVAGPAGFPTRPQSPRPGGTEPAGAATGDEATHRADAMPPPPARRALIVTHGMGQQLPFQEIQAAATTLRLGAERAGWRVVRQTARQMTLGDQTFPCLTVGFEADGGRAAGSASVDIYECYWAPLAEGQISLAEVVGFLYDAGKNGISFAVSRRPFERWMFGRVRELVPASPLGAGRFFLLLTAYAALAWWAVQAAPGEWGWLVGAALAAALYAFLTCVLPRTARYLCFALMVVAALVAMNGTILAVAAALTLRAGARTAGAWPTPPVRDSLTADLVTGLFTTALLFGLGIGLPYWSWLRGKERRRGYRGAGDAAAPGRPAGPGADGFQVPDAARLPARLCVGLAFAALIATAVLSSLHGLAAPDAPKPGLHGFPPLSWARALAERGGTPLAFAVWGGALALSRAVGTGFLIGYLGDVALYVSSHRLNRFATTRQEIRKAASDLTCAVYAAVRGREAGKDAEPLYDEVILSAHSLGAVVAYDAYNAAVNRDLLAGGAWRVAGRTRLMLTYGCPLDKVAFIFRSQGDAATEREEPREALAATVQPALTSYANRPRRWINVWSPDDWISGDLNFFDPHPSDRDPVVPWEPGFACRRVRNLQDPQAWVPLASHGMYGEGGLVPGLLFDAVTASDAQEFEAGLDARLSDAGGGCAFDPDPPVYAPLRRRRHAERHGPPRAPERP